MSAFALTGSIYNSVNLCSDVNIYGAMRSCEYLWILCLSVTYIFFIYWQHYVSNYSTYCL